MEELAFRFHPAVEPFEIEAVELGWVLADAIRYPVQQAVITGPPSRLLHLRSGLHSGRDSVSRRKDGFP
jgi:hypothetical protein